MSILNIFKKKQKKNNTVSKETNVTFPVLPCIEPSTLEKTKTDKAEDLSTGELILPIQEYDIKEKRRKDVFYHLPYEYNKAIKRQVEENYKTGKIEEFPLCKKISLHEYEELLKLYPEEMKYLENLYLPVYEEYMEEYLYKEETNFNDLTEFAKFIEKIDFYEGSMISDEFFNVVNDALNFYGKEMYGNNLFGIVKYFSLKYDNYLKVKNDIMSEIEILMNENMNDDTKREAVIKIKSKSGFYLSVSEGQYNI